MNPHPRFFTPLDHLSWTSKLTYCCLGWRPKGSLNGISLTESSWNLFTDGRTPALVGINIHMYVYNIYIDMIIYIYTCPKWKNSETKGTNYRYQFGAGLNVPYLWLGSGAFLAQQFSVVMVGSMASDARFRIGNSFPRSWQGKTTKISCAAVSFAIIPSLKNQPINSLL